MYRLVAGMALAGDGHRQLGVHAAAVAVLVIAAAVLAVLVACIVSPRWRRSVPRIVGIVLGGLLAVYLVVRGIAEFWVVDYSDPASYRHDWGGPSLIGVFAVHTGPGLAIMVAAVVWLYRQRHRTA
ncbi:hypothetical protein NGB36_32760 [Streptomyces sp. RB6PN25]|uniref:Integral membrane protein n=1 Tax=Streptomyces humicola TaxID=2953240 RepID=A0ABT1Q5K6_9ACTN|nr:hypothetical protein [Streptomyces humicola]MCQ4085204.1 hypothetical protein [Streptomyces humicola]